MDERTKLQKIRDIANDERTNPHIRKAAQEFLKRLDTSERDFLRMWEAEIQSDRRE